MDLGRRSQSQTRSTATVLFTTSYTPSLAGIPVRPPLPRLQNFLRCLLAHAHSPSALPPGPYSTQWKSGTTETVCVSACRPCSPGGLGRGTVPAGKAHRCLICPRASTAEGSEVIQTNSSLEAFACSSSCFRNARDIVIPGLTPPGQARLSALWFQTFPPQRRRARVGGSEIRSWSRFDALTLTAQGHVSFSGHRNLE